MWPTKPTRKLLSTKRRPPSHIVRLPSTTKKKLRGRTETRSAAQEESGKTHSASQEAHKLERKKQREPAVAATFAPTSSRLLVAEGSSSAAPVISPNPIARGWSTSRVKVDCIGRVAFARVKGSSRERPIIDLFRRPPCRGGICNRPSRSDP
jgi:hypothetical protein